MAIVPERLFAKANERGLVCIPSERGEHRIHPNTRTPDWQLMYQKGAWVLVIHGLPQIRFRYEEALKFLDQLDKIENAAA